ncbi:MAG: hypothetical protein WCJ99_03535 [Betaproteobacteria bacterium]
MSGLVSAPKCLGCGVSVPSAQPPILKALISLARARVLDGALFFMGACPFKFSLAYSS